MLSHGRAGQLRPPEFTALPLRMDAPVGMHCRRAQAGQALHAGAQSDWGLALAAPWLASACNLRQLRG